MSSTNRGGERIEHDAYYTPDNLASVLVGTLDLAPGVTVWEPHAGGGAFVRALMQVRGAYIIVSDIDECAPALSAELGSEGAVEDFLCAARSPVDWVVGNPPFTEAEAHARHALSQATVGVAFLLRLAFLEGKGRIPFWREHPAARVYVLAERPSFTGGKTDSCAYGWFVWDKRHVGPTQLHTLSWR